MRTKGVGRSVLEGLESRRLLSAAPTPITDLAIDEKLDFGFGGPTAANVGGSVYFSVPSRSGDTAGLWKADAAGNTTFVQTFSGYYPPTRPPVSNITSVGGTTAYFTVTKTNLSAMEIWRTDGTAAGTSKVAPASGSLLVEANGRVPFVRLGDATYFVAQGLWKVSDAAPNSATKIATGSISDIGLTVLNGSLFYLADNALWRLNAAGTGVTQVAAAPAGRGLTNVNGALYYTAQETVNYTTRLFKSDGTTAGTQDVAPISLSFGTSSTFAGIGNTVFFSGSDGNGGGPELWKSDGTLAGTGQALDVNPTGSSAPDLLTVFQGKLYFVARNGTGSARFLYRSDGTQGGTELVAGLDGDPTSDILEVRVVGDSLYFSARTTAMGQELYRVDAAGNAQLVSDRYPGRGSSRPRELIDVGGTLYYQGIDPVLGYALFKSDGTAAGTAMVKDYLPGPFDPLYINPWFANAGDGRLFYADGDNTSTGRELYVTDGTPGGTRMVKDVFPGAGASSPSYLTNINGTIYFSAESAAAVGRELWKTDGTAAGTVLVKDIHSNDRFQFSKFGSDPTQLTNVNGTLYFVADDGVHGQELWRSDGTDAGTVWFDLTSGSASSYPGNLTNVNGTLFFTVGNALWKIGPGDPAPASLKSFQPSVGTGSTAVRSLRAVNGTLYFAADDGSHGMELWKSNGTWEGTVMVKDVRLVSRYGDVSSRPDGFVALGNWVIFYADDGVTGRELFRSDGTAAGTVLLKDIYPNTNSDSLYNGSNPVPYVSLGGYVYFYAADVDHGGELWRTDGTPAGTTLVKDIRPGAGSSIPRWMQVVGDRIYFQADDGVTGVEVWTTDGTEAGTIRVADINPGAGGSTPTRFYDVNGAVVILASDSAHPPSLFRFEPEKVKPTVVGTRFTRVGGKAAIVVDFDEDVSGSLAGADLVVANLTTGQTLDPAAFTVAWDAGNNRATFTIGGGVLADGNYRVTLGANGVRDTSDNPLAADGMLDFFVLAGDANGDRVVNFDDLLVLAKNYNATGAGLAEGDFNGDGVVNFDDLLMLAKNYNKVLDAPVPPPPPAPAPVMAAAVLPKAPKRQPPSPVKPVFSTRPVVTPPEPVKAKSAGAPKRRA